MGSELIEERGGRSETFSTSFRDPVSLSLSLLCGLHRECKQFHGEGAVGLQPERMGGI